MSLSPLQLSQLCELAKATAIKAGDYIQSQFAAEIAKQPKVGGDSLASQVVTAVDFMAQEIILECLKDSIGTNNFGLLTEEATDDQSRLKKDYFWCVDPLDGTMPFTEKRTGYAVSIALISKHGDSVVGAVYIPDLRLCYSAYKGSGVFLNNQLFVRKSEKKTLHWYMDQSFLGMGYHERVQKEMEKMAQTFGYSDISYHSEFGGVRNAIGVMESGSGCYFKFPKNTDGCGSIWDYAATQLLMQESNLFVMSADGNTLNLNDPTTTFMHRQGILYATDEEIAEFVISVAKKWSASDNAWY